jgi:hypothetical protein
MFFLGISFMWLGKDSFNILPVVAQQQIYNVLPHVKHFVTSEPCGLQRIVKLLSALTEVVVVHMEMTFSLLVSSLGSL